MNKIWQIKESKFSDILTQLLFNRGIIDDNDKNSKIDKFLYPNFDQDFHSPGSLPGYKKAIERIKSAIDNREKVGIYADYDADGIPGAAFLYKTFLLFGIIPEVYIPTREIGYGFNQEGLDHLINKGCQLIISIDLGIKEFDLADYLQEKDIDLIITDHHIPDKKLPEAISVINPKIPGSRYPFSELSGAGVVFKLVQGLKEEYPKIITDSFLKWNLDLIAISTISDVVPLIDENRIIAKFGLKVLQKSKNIGIRAIYEQAGINPEKIDSYTVGFQIGPRINAPGRLDHATVSFEALIVDSLPEAKNLVSKLEKQNSQRQEMMEKIMIDANRLIKKGNLLKDKILVLSSKSWNKGVIGPVASNIVEKIYRPTILFCEEDNKFVGSARSIPGFNIVEAISEVDKFTLGYGGHAGAAGVQINKKDFNNFSKKLKKFVNKKLSEKDLQPKLIIDLELSKDKINISTFKKISDLEPFGLGNPRPIFVTKNIELLTHRYVGKDEKHLQLQFLTGKQKIKGILFNHQKESIRIKNQNFYDIVYVPSLNFWNGKWWPDLQIIDFKESTKND
jgi:single-stranded-DNA-specific exonuclease